MADLNNHKVRGDQFLKSALYHQAIDEYTTFLSTSLDPHIFANRSRCYACLGELNYAIVDAKVALCLLPQGNAKASYRLAHALFLKGDIEKADALCKEASQNLPADKALQQLKGMIERRLAGIAEPDPRKYVHQAATAHQHEHEHTHNHNSSPGSPSNDHTHSHEHFHTHSHTHDLAHDHNDGSASSTPLEALADTHDHTHSHQHNHTHSHTHDHAHDHNDSSASSTPLEALADTHEHTRSHKLNH